MNLVQQQSDQLYLFIKDEAIALRNKSCTTTLASLQREFKGKFGYKKIEFLIRQLKRNGKIHTSGTFDNPDEMQIMPKAVQQKFMNAIHQCHIPTDCKSPEEIGEEIHNSINDPFPEIVIDYVDVDPNIPLQKQTTGCGLHKAVPSSNGIMKDYMFEKFSNMMVDLVSTIGKEKGFAFSDFQMLMSGKNFPVASYLQTLLDDLVSENRILLIGNKYFPII